MTALAFLSSEALAELVDLVAAEVERRQVTAPVAARRWLSIAAAAELLDVDHKTVRSAIADGRLPAVNVGRALRVLESDLTEYLAYRPAGAVGGTGSRRPQV